jgi:hypothetical protein
MNVEQVAEGAGADAAATRDEGRGEEAGASGAEVGAELLSPTTDDLCKHGCCSVTKLSICVLGSRGAGRARA